MLHIRFGPSHLRCIEHNLIRASGFCVLWMRGMIVCDNFLVVKGKVIYYEGENVANHSCEV